MTEKLLTGDRSQILHVLRTDPLHSTKLLELSKKRLTAENLNFLSTVDYYQNVLSSEYNNLNADIVKFCGHGERAQGSFPSYLLIQDVMRDSKVVERELVSLRTLTPLYNEISSFLINNIIPKIVKEEFDDFSSKLNQLVGVYKNQKKWKKVVVVAKKMEVSFWVGVWERIRNLFDKAKELALGVWDTYISKTSDDQINLPAVITNDIQENIAKFPDVPLFKEAFDHISELVSTDLLPEYLATFQSVEREPESLNVAVLSNISHSPKVRSLVDTNSRKCKRVSSDNGGVLITRKSLNEIHKNFKTQSQPDSPTLKLQKLLGEECDVDEYLLTTTPPSRRLQPSLSRFKSESDPILPPIQDDDISPTILKKQVAPQPNHIKMSKLKNKFGDVPSQLKKPQF